MTRTFIQTKEFTKKWEKAGLIDKDLRRLEFELLKDPKAGKVLQGTGKLRKLRFAFEKEGKSGSVRICYVDFEEKKMVYLITMYSKNEKSNLSKAERNEIKKLIDILEKSL